MQAIDLTVIIHLNHELNDCSGHMQSCILNKPDCDLVVFYRCTCICFMFNLSPFQC